MKDLVRPCALKLDTRGVDKLGNGSGPLLSVIVEGVRLAVARPDVGDGGKTKRVCEGVESPEIWPGTVRFAALDAAFVTRLFRS